MGPVGRRSTGLVPDALALDRPFAFACAGILAAINAQSVQLLDMVRAGGLFTAITWLGGVSAVVWFALFALLKIGLQASARAFRRGDAAVLAAAILLAWVPISFAAQAALLVLGLYLFATSAAGQPDRRVAIVLLALTGPLLWGRLILNTGPLITPLLNLDAYFVGLILRSPADGNILHFAHSGQRFLIGAPCSSVHNISIAILLWGVALALFELRADRRMIGFGAAAVVAMFALNLARLASIGLFPDQFDFLHDGTGAVLFGWADLLGAALIVGIGVDDALRRQR